jgi:DNA-directed RNA polymerase subunit H (RpoH/RPB5)
MAGKELSGTTQTIFQSRRIILQQLERQGYNVEEYEDFTTSEVHTLMQSKQLDMLVENEEDNHKTYIKYHLNKTIRPNNIIEYVDDLFNLENILTKQDTLLIITKDDPNDTLIQQIKQLWETEKLFIIVYPIKRLQFNILSHSKVPDHQKLSQADKESFMKEYHISSPLQIPEISRFDPVSLAIGIRPGDICKIVRPSKTAITTNFYRLCI